MRRVVWRYRPKIGAPLLPPDVVMIPDKPYRWVARLRRRLDTDIGSEERTATLNEITTLMDLHAVFPNAQFDYYDNGRLPAFDDNRIGKFHAPDKGAPPTERRAAILIYPHTGTARRRVLDYIASEGERGATDEEVSLALQMRLYTAAPRRNELMNDGWIRDSGRERPTTTDTKAVVWVLTQQGREQYR